VRKPRSSASEHIVLHFPSYHLLFAPFLFPFRFLCFFWTPSLYALALLASHPFLLSFAGISYRPWLCWASQPRGHGSWHLYQPATAPAILTLSAGISITRSSASISITRPWLCWHLNTSVISRPLLACEALGGHLTTDFIMPRALGSVQSCIWLLLALEMPGARQAPLCYPAITHS
jgi:hypothetical protein